MLIGDNMKVGFDTEFRYRRYQFRGNKFHGDVTTFEPICVALVFEDGREIRVCDQWEALRPILEDPRYTFITHGCHAESLFCAQVGLPFPTRFIDTLLAAVMLVHAKSHDHGESAYYHAALARMTARYGIAHCSVDDKDSIRDSILRGTYLQEFGMARVLNYCADDARAGLQLLRPLLEDLGSTCGPHAETNLIQLYQPYALLMGATANKGLRFDLDGWGRAVEMAPRYRGRLITEMRKAGYDHDGEGLGQHGFRRMLAHLGLERTWRRTRTGMFSTKGDDLKTFRHIPAIDATYKLDKFDDFMGQDIGSLVDSDGKLRCSILPLAQRTSRNSTVNPNLMGIPSELRPLFLPDEGCKFTYFDFSQQEVGVAAFLTRDEVLLMDFATTDVYRSLGSRMGLLTPDMSEEMIRKIRNSILKALGLSLVYGKPAYGLARDLRCSLHEAELHLRQFARTYPRLCAWLRNYVVVALQRGWAENVIGYRAAFDVINPRARNHIARSAQNFPIQSSAAAAFQLTGLHLGDFGSDLRLPMHDAYVINVLDEPRALRDAREQIMAAATAATHQLFPGLAVRVDVEELPCFAKDSQVNSFAEWLAHLEDNPSCAVV
jgi:DNA polymerase I-like protein with 3'-5' exonuclease and polymerase domains